MLTSAARRRVFGEYQNTEPSRFIDEIPSELVEQELSSGSFGGQMRTGRSAGWEYRVNPYARPPQREASQSGGGSGAFKYEDEDQSTGLRPGMRVKHAQFGTGTVISVEDLGDDHKVVVRFTLAGSKTLRARFAKLERA